MYGKVGRTVGASTLPSKQMCSNDPRQALERFIVTHERQVHLASNLEAVADALPSFAAGVCSMVVHDLRHLLPPLHAFEEDHLFRLLGRRLASNSLMHVGLKRLRDEHAEDADAAADVSGCLENMTQGAMDRPMEALGFQIRALFVALRRHAAFEREVVLPEVRARFTYGDHALLHDILQRHDLGPFMSVGGTQAD